MVSSLLSVASAISRLACAKSRSWSVTADFSAFRIASNRLHVESSMAYEALERSLAGKERKLIDGLTPEQRFFISWAQGWRTKAREDATKRLVTVDVHAPGQIRSYGPLVNLQEFFDAFGIKEGDPMWRKPEDRAKIW